MLNFNIISPDEKNRIKVRKKIRVLIIWSTTLLALFVFILFLLVPSYIMVIFQQKEVLRNLEITKTSPLVKRIEDVRSAVTFLRGSALDIKKVTESSDLFSGIIHDLVSAIPSGVLLTTIAFDVNKHELSFQGTAQARADLINLEELLKKNKRFQSVSVPLASLVLSKDIPFSMKITVQQQ